MNPARLQQLERMHLEEPADPFPPYALGVEYLATDPARALNYFEALRRQQPDYLPTYYQAGCAYEALARPEEAAAVYRAGMDLSRRQHDSKTLNELRAALEALTD